MRPTPCGTFVDNTGVLAVLPGPGITVSGPPQTPTISFVGDTGTVDEVLGVAPIQVDSSDPTKPVVSFGDTYVSQLIAGTNVTLTPGGGTGVVQVSVTDVGVVDVITGVAPIAVDSSDPTQPVISFDDTYVSQLTSTSAALVVTPNPGTGAVELSIPNIVTSVSSASAALVVTPAGGEGDVTLTIPSIVTRVIGTGGITVTPAAGTGVVTVSGSGSGVTSIQQGYGVVVTNPSSASPTIALPYIGGFTVSLVSGTVLTVPAGGMTVMAPLTAISNLWPNLSATTLWSWLDGFTFNFSTGLMTVSNSGYYFVSVQNVMPSLDNQSTVIFCLYDTTDSSYITVNSTNNPGIVPLLASHPYQMVAVNTGGSATSFSADVSYPVLGNMPNFMWTVKFIANPPV